MPPSPRDRHNPYASPAALRAALKDKLAGLAAAHPGYQLPQLQRQFAYDRLLARLFNAPDRESWVLKGAGALLARLHTARHSADIDLYRRHQELPQADRALRIAATADLGDYFTYELGVARTLEQAGAVARIPVVARLGASEYARFHVDLIANIVMTGRPEVARSLVDIEIPGLVRPEYLIYPLPDHIADKVAAIHEQHPSAAGVPVESTRVKDLVDLVLIATTQNVDARALQTAVRSEESRRPSLTLPTTFTVPAAAIWDGAYRRLARDSSGLAACPTLEAAVVLTRRFIDPVLTGEAVGCWRPERLEWVDRPVERG